MTEFEIEKVWNRLTTELGDCTYDVLTSDGGVVVFDRKRDNVADCAVMCVTQGRDLSEPQKWVNSG